MNSFVSHAPQGGESRGYNCAGGIASISQWYRARGGAYGVTALPTGFEPMPSPSRRIVQATLDLKAGARLACVACSKAKA